MTRHELTNMRPAEHQKCKTVQPHCDRDLGVDTASADDKTRPTCARCHAKSLACVRAPPRPSFRHGSTANFDARLAHNQPWVNSRPRNWTPYPVTEINEARGPSRHIPFRCPGRTPPIAQASASDVPPPIGSGQSGIVRGEPWVSDWNNDALYNIRRPFSPQEPCILWYFINEL